MPLIATQGKVSFYHYDFTAQALAKISRGFDRDLRDVEAMYKQHLFTLSNLNGNFNAIKPELIRFPALNPDIFEDRVKNFINYIENGKK